MSYPGEGRALKDDSQKERQQPAKTYILRVKGCQWRRDFHNMKSGWLMERKTKSIRIRMAVPDDAPSIAAVLYESFIEYKSSYTPEAFDATTPTADQIQNRMQEGPVWIAVQDDSIVGTVAAVPKGEGLYIRGMAILPAARGHRAGEFLLREIESFAFERGFKRLYLSTTPFLARAIRLYEHYGFRLSSEGPHDLFGTPLFSMEKFLEP